MPRDLRILLVLIGLYVIFPIDQIPFIGVSLSAPLFAILFLATGRIGLFRYHKENRGLILRAVFLVVALLLSWVFNSVLMEQHLRIFDLLLGLRLPYWVFCMVLTALIVSRTEDPSVYLRVLGWGIIGLGTLRMGSAVVGGMWKVDRALALTQNSYGLLFSTFWPFSLTLLFVEKRSRHWIAAGGVATLLTAVAVNASRGSWVTVTLTTGLFFGTLILLFPVERRMVSRLAFLIVVFFVGAVAAVWLIPASAADIYVKRAQSFSDLEHDASYQTRVAMRRKALMLFKRNPILGVGPGQFTRVHSQFDRPERLEGKSMARLNRTSSHSGYYQFLAETGLVGTIALVVLLGWLLYYGWRAVIVASRRGLVWPMGLWLGLLGMSIHLIVIAGMFGTMVWFVYGLTGGSIVWIMRPRLTPERSSRTKNER